LPAAKRPVAKRVRKFQYNRGSLAVNAGKNKKQPPAPSSRRFALAERDGNTLASYLHNDVVWTISGPVDILPFCGQRVGKDGVMKLC